MGFDLTGKSGNYFRASCWSWRPILCLVHELNDEHHLGIDLEGWDYNDGKGLHSQRECDALAAAIEVHVAQGRKKYIMSNAGTNCRVNEQGRFLGHDEPGGQSPWETDADHVLQFATFLRECGGSFEIF